MKAIVPVAGAGTNLRPHTYTQPKPLIPVAGKPIVGFIIDQLLEAGIDEFVFIIGYLGEKIKLYVEENYPQIKAEYVHQETRMGLGHAIWMTRTLVKDTSELIIMLGDTIVDVDLNVLLASEHSSLGTKKVSDPRKFGVVELGADGFVKRVIEKPNIPKSNLAMVGLYKIREVEALMHILDQNIVNEKRTHGEFQLTDALMGLIEQGALFVPCEVNNWFDCGRKDILLETNATLLDRNPPSLKSMPATKNTIVIPPVSIGENCKICNSIIGPHVSIGSNATIDAAIISDSIIGSYSTITRFVLHHSVVGQDAAIRGMQRKLNIGDNTEIDLG
jgi:glucose-1-phosphate thymidylyltransferase